MRAMPTLSLEQLPLWANVLIVGIARIQALAL